LIDDNFNSPSDRTFFLDFPHSVEITARVCGFQLILSIFISLQQDDGATGA
jgi:hypothetical protein